MVRLSDFKGRYILLEFWASWCKPCRQEIPNIVEAYKSLKSSRFEIVGISMDTDRASWLDAVKNDGMHWVQLSDLKGIDNANPTAVAYSVSGVPVNYLINPEGKIVAKNLRGKELLSQLQKFIQ